MTSGGTAITGNNVTTILVNPLNQMQCQNIIYSDIRDYNVINTYM